MRNPTAFCWLIAASLLGVPFAAHVAAQSESQQAESDEAENEYSDGQNILRADIAVFARLLELTPEQKSAAMDLHSAYTAQYKSAQKKINEYQQAFSQKAGDNPGPDAWKEAQPVWEKYNKHIEKLRTTLFDDLKSLLSASQLDLWPKVERRLRRRETVQYAMAAGAGADLVALTEQVMKPDPLLPETTPILEQYEIELDRALVGVEAFRHEAEVMWRDRRDEFEKMSQEEQLSMQKRYYLDGLNRSRAARDVNIRTMAAIARTLPESRRDEFELLFLGESFRSNGYHEQNREIGGQIDAAMKLADLTPDQRERLEGVRAALRHDLKVLLQREVDETIKREDSRTVENVYDTNGDPGLVDKVRREHADLRNRSIEAVRAALRPEQLDKLGAPFKKIELPVVEFDE